MVVLSKSSPKNHWAKGIPSTITEGGCEGISRNGVVAGIPNAPDGAHARSDRVIGLEPKPAFVPSVPRAKALNPPRKNSLRFSMIIPAFRDLISFSFYRKHTFLRK